MLKGSGFTSVAAVFAATTFACGGESGGEVIIDGSSTVFPIAEAVGEDFQARNPRIRVSVGFSGSGGGFKRFCAGETDISNASRSIRESEVQECVRGVAGDEYALTGRSGWRYRRLSRLGGRGP